MVSSMDCLSKAGKMKECASELAFQLFRHVTADILGTGMMVDDLKQWPVSVRG